jgi:hypothetical protein
VVETRQDAAGEVQLDYLGSDDSPLFIGLIRLVMIASLDISG